MTDFTSPHIALHIHEQRCLNCGAHHTYSHAYQVVTVGTAKKLLPLRTPSEAHFSGLPIVKTVMPADDSPLCLACVDTFSTTSGAEAHRAWQETLKRKRTAPPLTVVSSTPTSRTIDDLE